MKIDRWAVAALAMVSLMTLTWPGDVQWGGDILLLMERALDLNATGQFATHGLLGSKGVEYGPTPLWIYQAMLAITHHPIALVLIHATMMLGLTIWALLWIAKLLKIDPLWVAVVLASPHWMFYGRWLWDNPMCIPMSCLLLAAWIDFQRTPAMKTFILLLVCGLVLPTIHPMSLPLCIAIGLDLLVRPRQWLKYAPLGVIVLGLFFAAYWRYIVHVHGQIGAPLEHRLSLTGAAYPFLGARVLTGWRLSDYFFPPQWWSNHFRYVDFLFLLGGFAFFILSWAGIGRLIASPTDRRTSVVLLGAMVAMVVIGASTDARGFPHYFNGVWPLFVVFVWEGLRHYRIDRRRVLAGLFAYNVTLTAALMVAIHVSGGTDEAFGPTLSNQIAIMEQLRRTPPRSVDVQVPYLKQFSNAIPLLARMIPGPAGAPTTQRAVIKPDSPGSPNGRSHVAYEP